MNIRLLAESDLALLMEDTTHGGSWPITLENPDGQKSDSMSGLSNDIGLLVDPDTGVAVSGRLATLSIRTSSLLASGLGIPEDIKESDKKPWKVTFTDVNLRPYTFKIATVAPDRGAGVMTFTLEVYV